MNTRTLFAWLLCIAVASSATALDLSWLPFVKREATAADKAAVEAAVEKRIAADLAAKPVDQQALAESLGLGWPLQEPSVSIADVTGIVTMRTAEFVERKFPKATNFRAEAEAAYTPILMGQQVEVSLRLRGPAELVRGTLHRVTTDWVQIGDLRVPIEDLPEDMRWRIVPGLFAAGLELKTREIQTAFEEGRAAYEASTRTAMEQKAFTLAGYIRRGSEWLSQADYLAVAVAAAEDERRQQLYPTYVREEYDRRDLKYPPATATGK